MVVSLYTADDLTSRDDGFLKKGSLLLQELYFRDHILPWTSDNLVLDGFNGIADPIHNRQVVVHDAIQKSKEEVICRGLSQQALWLL